MSRIENTIARIPSMDGKSQKTLRDNAAAVLAKSPDNADARQLLEVLDAISSAKPKPAEFEVTGLLAWEKYRPGEGTFLAFHGERIIGRIFKRADHSNTDKNVYSLEILGVVIPRNFHYIQDARDAGEKAFAFRTDERQG